MSNDAPADIVIPAGRGARHKARRLARANPMAQVKVKTRRGIVHYTARARIDGEHNENVRVDTWTFYRRGRGGAVIKMVQRAYNSQAAIDLDNRQREKVRAIMDLMRVPRWVGASTTPGFLDVVP